MDIYHFLLFKCSYAGFHALVSSAYTLPKTWSLLRYLERQKTKHLSRYLEDQGSAPHHLRSPACCFPSGPATYFAPLPAWPSVTWVTGRLHGGGPTVRLTKNNGFLIKTWLVNLSKWKLGLIWIWMYICLCITIRCIYINITIYIERERDRLLVY